MSGKKVQTFWRRPEKPLVFCQHLLDSNPSGRPQVSGNLREPHRPQLVGVLSLRTSFPNLSLSFQSLPAPLPPSATRLSTPLGEVGWER